jgi:hypothetical protein
LYKGILSNKPIIDVWNLLKRGSSIWVISRRQ